CAASRRPGRSPSALRHARFSFTTTTAERRPPAVAAHRLGLTADVGQQARLTRPLEALLDQRPEHDLQPHRHLHRRRAPDGPRSRVALDFGASSLIALAQQSIEPNSLDAILLTHLHGDHCGGVPFLLIDAMLAARRTRPLTIAGPRDLERRLGAIREALFPGSHVMTPTFPLSWIELEPGQPHTILDLVVTPQPARHTVETNPTALRVEVGGRVVAYTGDTEWTEDVARVARDADLLIAECYFYAKPVK